MSGLVARVGKWIRFEEAWIDALKDEGLTERFHMSRFVFGGRGYEAWKDNDKKRAETAERLLRIIKRHTQKSFVSGVYTADFRKVAADYDIKAAHLTPYSLCGQEAMSHIWRWKNRNRNNQFKNAKIMFVFERGDTDQKSLEKRLNLFDGAPVPYDRPSYDPMLDGPFGFPPFQACDLIAWSHVRTARAIIRQESPRLFEVMLAYQKQIPNLSKFHNEQTLRKYCEIPAHLVNRREKA